MKERVESLRFVAIGVEQLFQFVMKVVDVVGNDVGQVSILGLVPDVFHGVKFRCIGWQPFHSQPIRARVEQLSDRRSMGGQPIADQDDRPTQLRMDFTQKPH